MKSSILLSLLVGIGSLFTLVFFSSCKTVENPSPHTEKVREQNKNLHNDIMRRHHRHNRH